MSLLGEVALGDFELGEVWVDPPLPIFEVDWQRKGYFDGHADGPVVSYSSNSGRSYFLNTAGDGFEEDDTGKIEIVLSNLDDIYTWSNTSSPLYPYVQAGKRFRLRTRSGLAIHDVAVGTITKITDDMDDRGRKFVRLEALNDLNKLRRQSRSVTIPLQVSAYADDIIHLILNSIGWPGGRDLKSGVDIYPFWWSDSESASALIYGVAHAELGSFYVTANGTAAFRTRYNTPPVAGTLTDAHIDINSLKTSSLAENVRTLVSATAQPISPTGIVTVYQLTNTIYLGPSGDSATVVMWGDYSYNNASVAVLDPISPVATTDYTANTIDGGGGVDKTADVSLTASFFSARFKMTIVNSSGVGVYVTYKIRGNALVKGSAVTFEQNDPDSIYEPSEFDFRSKHLQNVNTARSVAASLFTSLRTPRPIHSFNLVPDDYATMLGMDLGQRYTVDAPGCGIVGAYKVIRVRQAYDAGANIPFKTNIFIEPVTVLPSGSGSTVPVTVPFTAGAI